MLWTIEGADRRSGQERVLSVDVETHAQAVAYAIAQGLLVSDVHESIVGKVAVTVERLRAEESPPEPPQAPGAEPEPVTPVANPIDYPFPVHITPAYTGLQVGGTMLFWLALFFYIGSFSCACIFAWLAAVHWPDLMNEKLLYLGAAIAAVLIAGLLHAASSACKALRDIARDLLRDVTRVVVASSGRDDASNPSTIEGAGA